MSSWRQGIVRSLAKIQDSELPQIAEVVYRIIEAGSVAALSPGSTTRVEELAAVLQLPAHRILGARARLIEAVTPWDGPANRVPQPFELGIALCYRHAAMRAAERVGEGATEDEVVATLRPALLDDWGQPVESAAIVSAEVAVRIGGHLRVYVYRHVTQMGLEDLVEVPFSLRDHQPTPDDPPFFWGHYCDLNMTGLGRLCDQTRDLLAFVRAHDRGYFYGTLLSQMPPTLLFCTFSDAAHDDERMSELILEGLDSGCDAFASCALWWYCDLATRKYGDIVSAARATVGQLRFATSPNVDQLRDLEETHSSAEAHFSDFSEYLAAVGDWFQARLSLVLDAVELHRDTPWLNRSLAQLLAEAPAAARSAVARSEEAKVVESGTWHRLWVAASTADMLEEISGRTARVWLKTGDTEPEIHRTWHLQTIANGLRAIAKNDASEFLQFVSAAQQQSLAAAGDRYQSAHRKLLERAVLSTLVALDAASEEVVSTAADWFIPLISSLRWRPATVDFVGRRICTLIAEHGDRRRATELLRGAVLSGEFREAWPKWISYERAPWFMEETGDLISTSAPFLLAGMSNVHSEFVPLIRALLQR